MLTPNHKGNHWPSHNKKSDPNSVHSLSWTYGSLPIPPEGALGLTPVPRHQAPNTSQHP